MALEINLPETAKALSAPVTKLIEVLSAGCGKLYEPTGIRRRANAEGDALVIMEEAKARANEVSVRAAQRLLDTEERRQQNIEAIAAEAIQHLPPDVSQEPVDPDWSARFFAECQDIGNEQMRRVWGKILAGEVAKPGSFSPRTLWVLKNLTAREAQAFNTLCKYSFRSGGGRSDVFPFVGIPNSEFWFEKGLQFVELQQLQAAGLISNGRSSVHWYNFTRLVLLGPRVSLLVTAPTRSDKFSMGDVVFTSEGTELAQICEWDIPDSRLEQVEASIRPPLTVERILVDEFDASGVRYRMVDPPPKSDHSGATLTIVFSPERGG